MSKYGFSGKLDLESPAIKVIEYISRKKTHVSLFYAAVDLWFKVVWKNPADTMLVMSIHGRLISESYKTVIVNFTIPPREDRARFLEYIFDFEKIRDNIKDAKIVESLLTYIRLSDFSYKWKVKHNSTDTPYPAEECLKYLFNAFKNDDEVEMGPRDWDEKKFTLSFTNAPGMMEKFETNIVTITIIPKNEGSRVKWTIRVEKVDEDTQESESFLFIAGYIRETIESKFRN